MKAAPGVEKGKPRALSREVTVSNTLGIHARPAALFVRMAGRFRSDITIEKDGERVPGKSIMALLMLAAGKGSTLQITAEGDDAAEALDELSKLFAEKFNED